MSGIAIARLIHLCDTIPALLRAIEETTFSFKPSQDKWSKKEILGHLIDSATNNHQRFVRGQFEDVPFIIYDQVEWNKNSFYQSMETHQIIHFWEQYNRQLIALLHLIPAENMLKRVDRGEDEPKTLDFILDDYVTHMEHHLRQILSY